VTVRVFIPDIPEFLPLVRAAEEVGGYTVRAPQHGYWTVEADQVLRFSRKELKLGPAIWNSALSGGFIGRIVAYGRDEMVIESEP
jgi:hypothetical protein